MGNKQLICLTTSHNVICYDCFANMCKHMVNHLQYFLFLICLQLSFVHPYVICVYYIFLSYHFLPTQIYTFQLTSQNSPVWFHSQAISFCGLSCFFWTISSYLLIMISLHVPSRVSDSSLKTSVNDTDPITGRPTLVAILSSRRKPYRGWRYQRTRMQPCLMAQTHNTRQLKGRSISIANLMPTQATE